MSELHLASHSVSPSLFSLSFISSFIHRSIHSSSLSSFSLPPSQDVKPCLVATALSGIRRTSRLVPDPITYARAAVATIGIQHTTYGYFYHALQVGISVAMVTDLQLVFSVVTCDDTHAHASFPPQHYMHTQANIFGLVPDWLFDFITWMFLPAFKERYLKKAKQS